MNRIERKEYRIALLKEIYEHNFNNKFKPYRIAFSDEEVNGEKYLAIKYLIDRGYIRNQHPDYNNYTLVITYDGIDLVEKI